MKKDKKVKGLVVSKETLRCLDDQMLSNAVGGKPPLTVNTRCFPCVWTDLCTG